MKIGVKTDLSKFGKGLFSTYNFKKDEVIFKFTGYKMHFEDTILLGDKECYPIQVGKDLYIYADEPFCFINHSCEPNCGINEHLELIALEDIKIDEELFFDYSTTMLERRWQMNCLCNSPFCRNLIQDFDLLPEQTQLKYIKLNVVQPFILQHIKSRVEQDIIQ
jgi:hypothetical protein